MEAFYSSRKIALEQEYLQGPEEKEGVCACCGGGSPEEYGDLIKCWYARGDPKWPWMAHFLSFQHHSLPAFVLHRLLGLFDGYGFSCWFEQVLFCMGVPRLLSSFFTSNRSNVELGTFRAHDLGPSLASRLLSAWMRSSRNAMRL